MIFEERLLLAVLNFLACIFNVWAYLRWGSVLSLSCAALAGGGALLVTVVGWGR